MAVKKKQAKRPRELSEEEVLQNRVSEITFFSKTLIWYLRKASKLTGKRFLSVDLEDLERSYNYAVSFHTSKARKMFMSSLRKSLMSYGFEVQLEPTVFPSWEIRKATRKGRSLFV